MTTSESKSRKIASEENVKPKILVVEDDQELQEAYRVNLNEHFHLISVLSGAGGLAVLKSIKGIDFVMLDYQLPDMSGIDVLKEIKSIFPFLPVILVTGHGTEDICLRSFRSGITDYIKKPFEYPDLISIINNHVSCGHRHQKSCPIRGCREVTEGKDSLSLSLHHLQVQKVIKYINENYMTAINLQQMSSLACMSPSYFSRVFREVCGIGFKERQHRKRIEMAIKLLPHSDLSIAEIAYAVGYVDLTHFERIFKKATKLTPTGYRTLHWK